MASGPRGIVFDFDGVIMRSMELHAEAYRRVLSPYGIEPTDREVFLQEGARSETIIKDALEGAGKDASKDIVERLADKKQETYQALGPPDLYDGAKRLIEMAHGLTKDLALVTGTRRANLELFIPDLLPLFRSILAQEAYTHDKPHPEPYAKAADALDIEPRELVVIENAIRGVESARAAGYGAIIGITTTLTARDLTDADHVVRDHDEAGQVLERLFRGPDGR